MAMASPFAFSEYIRNKPARTYPDEQKSGLKSNQWFGPLRPDPCPIDLASGAAESCCAGSSDVRSLKTAPETPPEPLLTVTPLGIRAWALPPRGEGQGVGSALLPLEIPSFKNLPAAAARPPRPRPHVPSGDGRVPPSVYSSIPPPLPRKPRPCLSTTSASLPPWVSRSAARRPHGPDGLRPGSAGSRGPRRAWIAARHRRVAEEKPGFSRALHCAPGDDHRFPGWPGSGLFRSPRRYPRMHLPWTDVSAGWGCRITPPHAPGANSHPTVKTEMRQSVSVEGISMSADDPAPVNGG